jgi:hypothetical protein
VEEQRPHKKRVPGERRANNFGLLGEEVTDLFGRESA